MLTVRDATQLLSAQLGADVEPYAAKLTREGWLPRGSWPIDERGAAYLLLGVAGTANPFRATEALDIDLSAFGIDGTAAPGEAAMAITNELALGMRREMPGPMSDSDRPFLVGIQPGIGQTREGRKLLIATRKKLNARKAEVAKRARAYQRKNGQLDAGFEDELATWAEANPIFGEDDLTALEEARLPHPDEAGFNELPPGTYYISPGGDVRRKPLE